MIWESCYWKDDLLKCARRDRMPPLAGNILSRYCHQSYDTGTYVCNKLVGIDRVVHKIRAGYLNKIAELGFAFLELFS